MMSWINSPWFIGIATGVIAADRFGDTFAVGLPQGWVSIENVAKLLGHASIEITEKHYVPWVKSRQDLLEREIWRVYEIGTDL
jgi:hypothetical protein